MELSILGSNIMQLFNYGTVAKEINFSELKYNGGYKAYHTWSLWGLNAWNAWYIVSVGYHLAVIIIWVCLIKD